MTINKKELLALNRKLKLITKSRKLTRDEILNYLLLREEYLKKQNRDRVRRYRAKQRSTKT